jgi:hypothetical protein
MTLVEQIPEPPEDRKACYYCGEMPIAWVTKRVCLGCDEKIMDALEKLDKIKDWCGAYPLKVFPEPDFKKAAKVLKENGMTIDAISASNMRHVLEGIKKIIEL